MPAATPLRHRDQLAPPGTRSRGGAGTRHPPQAPQAAAWGTLVVTRDMGASTTHRLAGSRTVLGRHRRCDVVLDDPTVSRRHASIEPCEDAVTLVDTGSLNGTYLNRSPLEHPTPLADGDEIRIGEARLVYHPAPL